MRRHTIETQAISEATPETVWHLIADVTSWAAWGPWDETERARDGWPDIDGVGAIRHMWRGRRRSVEAVETFDAPHRFGYELLEGLPLNDYHAEVILEPRDGGTLIRWRATFDGSNPLVGAFLAPGLNRFLGMVARKLARAAEAEERHPLSAA